MTETTALLLAFGVVYAGLAAYALFLLRAGRADAGDRDHWNDGDNGEADHRNGRRD